MANSRIGGLWKGKEGSKALLSGSIDLLGEDIRVVIFKNDKKEGKQPDYFIVRSRDIKEAQTEPDCNQAEVPF